MRKLSENVVKRWNQNRSLGILLGVHAHHLDCQPRLLGQQVVQQVAAVQDQLQLLHRLRADDRLVHAVHRLRPEHAAVQQGDVRLQVPHRLHPTELLDGRLAALLRLRADVVQVVEGEALHGSRHRHPQVGHQVGKDLLLQGVVERRLGGGRFHQPVEVVDGGGGAGVAPGAFLVALQVAGQQALQHAVGVDGNAGQQRHRQHRAGQQGQHQPPVAGHLAQHQD